MKRPSCGNLVVDSIVWFWTACICCETTRRTYNKYVVSFLNFDVCISTYEINFIFLDGKQFAD